MKKLNDIFVSSLFLSVLLFFTGGVQAEEKHDSVPLKKESVVQVEWERVEGAFRYRLILADVELASGVGSENYIHHDGPLDDLKVKAFTIEDKPLGETKIVTTKRMDRLVLRWNEDDFKMPFLGLLTSSSPGSHESLTMELKKSPFIIGYQARASTCG